MKALNSRQVITHEYLLLWNSMHYAGHCSLIFISMEMANDNNHKAHVSEIMDGMPACSRDLSKSTSHFSDPPDF